MPTVQVMEAPNDGTPGHPGAYSLAWVPGAELLQAVMPDRARICAVITKTIAVSLLPGFFSHSQGCSEPLLLLLHHIQNMATSRLVGHTIYKLMSL